MVHLRVGFLSKFYHKKLMGLSNKPDTDRTPRFSKLMEMVRTYPRDCESSDGARTRSADALAVAFNVTSESLSEILLDFLSAVA